MGRKPDDTHKPQPNKNKRPRIKYDDKLLRLSELLSEDINPAGIKFDKGNGLGLAMSGLHCYRKH